MNGTDARGRALALVRYLGTGYASDRGNAETILDECTEPEQLGDVLLALLDLFATLAPRLRTAELGIPVLYAALTEIAAYAQDLDQRPAAELIVAYRWFTTEDLTDNMFRDQGAGELDFIVDQVNKAGRIRETIMAVVDVWLQMLPELDSREGTKLLYEHAGE
ncbi:MAG: hypothetical protein JWR37_2092 [Mycobacterium sp.]|nr:hypothetical protein [Mycobacterium sp.]